MEYAGAVDEGRIETPASAGFRPPIVEWVVRVAQWMRERLGEKGRARRKEQAPLRLVAQISLGGRRTVALIEAGGSRFLVGGGADQVTVLTPVPAAAAQKTEWMETAQ